MENKRFNFEMLIAMILIIGIAVVGLIYCMTSITEKEEDGVSIANTLSSFQYIEEENQHHTTPVCTTAAGSNVSGSGHCSAEASDDATEECSLAGSDITEVPHHDEAPASTSAATSSQSSSARSIQEDRERSDKGASSVSTSSRHEDAPVQTLDYRGTMGGELSDYFN